MAYDEMLAERVRDALCPTRSDVIEKKMFGGMAFMLNGYAAVSLTGDGGLLVRADPEEEDELLAREGVERFAMNGRESRGWLVVDGDALEDDATLDEWVARGVASVRALPRK